MELKICGLRDNFFEVVTKAKPEFAGLIFYPPSPRHVGNMLDAERVRQMESGTKKIGIFVNESPKRILEIAKAYKLDGVQFHGDEPTAELERIKKEGLLVFKALRIAEKADFDTAEDYADIVNYFVFDAKGTGYGGNGIRFDWSLLETYTLQKPFLLSGGIGLEDLSLLQGVAHPQLVGIDVNSGFEVRPALKSIPKLKKLIDTL